MNRASMVLCVLIGVGCAREQFPNASNRGEVSEVEDGGAVNNTDRDKATAFFEALSDVQSVEEERKLLTEFGEWLDAKKYGGKVETINGMHRISCPFFPPDTPWANHAFLDIKNLDLLPSLQGGG